MGYFFTLLFLTTAYITPSLLFGSLHEYHIETILAVLAFLASIPNLSSAGIFRLPQTYAALLLTVAVAFSVGANGWLGGMPAAVNAFLPVVAAFFLIAINVRSRLQLQGIVLALFLCSAFYIFRGFYDLQTHDFTSPYIYGGEALPRLRGLGFVNDPNDLAQVLVSLVPCIFLWRKQSTLLNVVLVWVPVAILVAGMFLSHSRGSAIALMVVAMAAMRKKIGTVPAAIMAGLLLVGALALGWSGGRDVSVEAGADRLDAWTVGIQLIKSHPLFGVGFHAFADFNDITAHNSIIVCAAEIGLPAYMIWVLFIFSTVRQGLWVTRAEKLTVGSEPDVPLSAADAWRARLIKPSDAGALAAIQEPVIAPTAAPPVWIAGLNEITVEPDTAEFHRLARQMLICMVGFLAAGWFLSRALSIWLFAYSGMVCAIFRMAERSGLPVRQDGVGYTVRISAAIAVGLLIGVYILLKVRSVLGK